METGGFDLCRRQWRQRWVSSLWAIALAIFLMGAQAQAQQYYWSGFAGGGQWGSADGTGSAAQFDGPCAVAVDGSGNLYIADTYNYTIRKVTPGAVVTTLAGSPGVTGSADGTGSAARFGVGYELGMHGPMGIAATGSGTVYVADSANSTIRKVTSGGVVTTLAGSPLVSGTADGTGSAARFYYR
jgi:hypothetical protein